MEASASDIRALSGVHRDLFCSVCDRRGVLYGKVPATPHLKVPISYRYGDWTSTTPFVIQYRPLMPFFLCSIFPKL